MEPQNLQTLSRFPFLTQSSEYIKSLKLSIEEILKNIAYRSAWSRAQQRLQEALELGEVHEHGATSDAEYINEMLSYVLARIIVSCVKDQYLVRRYALAEAVFMYHDLQNRSIRFVAEVGEQFELSPKKIGDTELELIFSNYLKYSTFIRAPEWKLVNRDVSNGLVVVTKRELARLIQEALRFKILTDLPIEVELELKEMIIPRIKELITLVQTRKRKFETHDLGRVSITRFPPCMKQLLGMTQAGENVPHVGRFAIAAFLHHIGLSSEQILNVFSTSPDFAMDKARYQIEHITGKISGTEYTPPSCDTLKSNNVCFNPDTLCKKDWMNHPLTYYKIKGKKRKAATNGKSASKK